MKNLSKIILAISILLVVIFAFYEPENTLRPIQLFSTGFGGVHGNQASASDGDYHQTQHKPKVKQTKSGSRDLSQEKQSPKASDVDYAPSQEVHKKIVGQNPVVPSPLALKNISAGSVFFEPKKTMTYKRSTEVNALIFRKKVNEIEKNDIIYFLENYSSVVGKEVPHVGEEMLAELTGPSDVFKIEPSGKIKAVIDKEHGYNWKWHVTPKKKVDSSLFLTIYLNGQKPIRQVSAKILVESNEEYWKDSFDSFLNFIEKHPLLSALFGSGGLGGLIFGYLQWKFAKKKHEGSL